MKQNIFENNDVFRNSFEQGLVKLLNYNELGVFVLVLANASFDQHVYNFTEQAILTKYHRLRRYYRHAILEGHQLDVPEDDLLVFLKLLAISIDNIRETEFRHEKLWEIQFNHLRSMKPARMSNHKFCGIQLDFNADGFNFNKPYVQKEILWKGEISKKSMSIFYNKFPFARFHCLLVPDKDKEINQFLTLPYHQYIWKVTKSLSKSIHGLGIAYNSYGAYCSVNHLHFHLFIKGRPLPIMNSRWAHNGGRTVYPLQCKIFRDYKNAWDYIDKLNKQQIAYNLIYQKNILYCILRKHQCHIELPSWSSGMGWYEVSGGFTTFNHDDFIQMKDHELNNTLSAFKIKLKNDK